MQVGSFMECYGLIDRSTNTIHSSKIQDFSRICELNIAEKNIYLKLKVEMILAYLKKFLNEVLKAI
jgi:hypothetical protein